MMVNRLILEGKKLVDDFNSCAQKWDFNIYVFDFIKLTKSLKILEFQPLFRNEE